MANRSEASAATKRINEGMEPLEAGLPPIEEPKIPSDEGVPKTARLKLGAMLETNGAGSLEAVEGFDAYRARNRGLFQPSAAPPILWTKGVAFTPENVIGRDDRVPVGDTTKLPWRAIAMLTITYETGVRALGTAWFLGRRALGTAGHNIVHPDYGAAREILITPAYDGEVAPYGSFYAVDSYCDPAWRKGNHTDLSLDYGVLLIDDPTVGDRIGWFGFAAYPDADLRRLLVNVSGYVVKRTPATQYFSGGRLDGPTGQFLLYDFDTSSGMSGSPIFALFGTKRVVVGIHTYGSDRGNRARRIDDDLYDLLDQFT